MSNLVYSPRNNMSPTISHTYATNKYQGPHIIKPSHMRAITLERYIETTQKIKEYR